MADKNILKDLMQKIDVLEKNIKDLKTVIDKDKNEMDDIESQINTLKAKYEMKRLDVYQLNCKLEEKVKIANEAKKAYSKIIENTTRLIEAVDIENNEDLLTNK